MINMTLDEGREALMSLQRKMAAYDHAAGLIYYDGCTTAPKATAENRGATLSILSEEMYRLAASEETAELLSGAVLYLRIYFLGMPALAVYNFGQAVFSAAGDTRKPLMFVRNLSFMLQSAGTPA